MGFEAIIPHMTNNNTPSPFVASASNQLASYAPFNAFQDNGNAWISDVANSYIQIDLGRPYEVTKVFISSVNSWTNARMRSFTLQGSGDGIHWITLEVANTTGYEFTKEHNYGAFRYWRLRSGTMTARGGAIGRFQLYQDDFGGTMDIKSNDLWIVDGRSVELKGGIYPSQPIEMCVEINGVISEEWVSIINDTDIEIAYSSNDFQDGANVITVKMRNAEGTIKQQEYVFYKLNKERFGYAGATYQFKIMNNTRFPQNDPWIGQIYNFDYLNSEVGVSFMFRYKPYSQIIARIENQTNYANKDDRNNVSNHSQPLFGSRLLEGKSTVSSPILSTIRTIRETIKYDGYQLGFKEAGLVQDIFEAWGVIDKKDIGIVSTATLSMKRDKVVKDMLGETKIPAHRKQEIQNTMSVLGGYMLGVKPGDDTVISYLKLFEEAYPYKETIVALGYLNASEEEKIGIRDLIPALSKKIEGTTPNTIDLYFGITEEGRGVLSNYINGTRIPKTDEAISSTQLVASKTESHGSKYSHITLGVDGEGEGIIEQILNATKDMNKQGIINDVLICDQSDNRIVQISEFILSNKDDTLKEFMTNWIVRVETLDVESNIITSMTNVNLQDVEAFVEKATTDVNIMNIDARLPLIDIRILDKLPTDAQSYQENIILLNKMSKDTQEYQNGIIYIDKTNKDANNLEVGIIAMDKLPKDIWNLETNIIKVDPMPLDMLIGNHTNSYFDKLPKDMWNLDVGIIKFNKMPKDMWIVNPLHAVNKTDNKEGRPVFEHFYFDGLGKNIHVIEDDLYTDKVNTTAYDFGTDLSFVDKSSKDLLRIEVNKFLEKVSKEVFKVEVINTFNAVEKSMFIIENWDFFTRTNQQGKTMEEAAVLFIKEERIALELEDKQALREKKDMFLIEQLVLDYEHLNGYITELAGNFERVDEFDTVALSEILSDKIIAKGFIEESILSHRKNQEKDAIVVEDFVLAGDGSEWEDIWNRYSPGVDVLDPPDDDYDYGKLTPMVYDEITGKPIKPIGPTNTANVYVAMPLSHPIPENNEVGIDETKRIAVDNYIFIDSVLALESIKNRNKLRYAGMPAGKTIREVFSQLYTWIQQAAPGHEEYERMFRFMRWYAESITIKQSKFLLERIYNPWRSSFHTGGGLGLPHTKPGWVYNSMTSVLETTSLSAHLEFSKELMIDGELILRGYFDNPLSQGTIEISVDGVVVDSFSSNGVFTRNVEVPQGVHNFKVHFMGISSKVSISTIEITGVQFVSATTITDDSDTNGLKALTELMAQLLGYFELHHGGRKVKGTMEIRQRAVWNTHT